MSAVQLAPLCLSSADWWGGVEGVQILICLTLYCWVCLLLFSPSPALVAALTALGCFMDLSVQYSDLRLVVKVSRFK